MSARVRVAHTVAFADGPGGGNPCPVVFGAEGWSDEEMRAAAAGFGHETCFVLPPSSPASGAAARLRYFVPNHEMEMCVHATVAASVLLGVRGRRARGDAAGDADRAAAGGGRGDRGAGGGRGGAARSTRSAWRPCWAAARRP